MSRKVRICEYLSHCTQVTVRAWIAAMPTHCISVHNWISVFALFLLASFGVTLPLDWENLEGKVGGNVTLPTTTTGLQGDFSVVWSLNRGTDKQPLIICNGGHIDRKPPKSFEGRLNLDKPTGSLTIEQLTIEDSCVYEGTITDGNSNVHTYVYKVTVSEPLQTTVSPDSAHCWRAQLTLSLNAVCVWFFDASVQRRQSLDTED